MLGTEFTAESPAHLASGQAALMFVPTLRGK